MGTVSELRDLIDQGIGIGLKKFTDKYARDMEKYAYKAEQDYYDSYSSWYDPFRHYDLMNIHEISSYISTRGCQIKIRFSSDNMVGGHGIWRPLSDYAPDPEQVFEWGFETGHHGWYVQQTSIREYWEIYHKNLQNRAQLWANRYVKKGLQSVGL